MLDHFLERQRLHPSALGLLILGAVIEAALALILRGNVVTHIVQWAIAALFLLIAIVFRDLVIKVGPETLVFGFGPVRRTVRLMDIVDVKIVDAGVPNPALGTSAGVGIHRNPDGSLAFIARRGTAVAIKIKDRDPRAPGGYLISTARPHDLAMALRSGQSN